MPPPRTGASPRPPHLGHLAGGDAGRQRGRPPGRIGRQGGGPPATGAHPCPAPHVHSVHVSRGPLTRRPNSPPPPPCLRRVHVAQVFKYDCGHAKAGAASGRHAGEGNGPARGNVSFATLSSAEDKPPPPLSPSAGVPPVSSPRSGKNAAKSPRGVPPPPHPTVKRSRRDGPASPAPPRKAATPVTPAPSNSGSEDSQPAGTQQPPSRAAAQPPAATAGRTPKAPPPIVVPPKEEDDEALARRLHAELNCTPARASRNRGGAAAAAAAAAACGAQAARDRVHGEDPGLLPSC